MESKIVDHIEMGDEETYHFEIEEFRKDPNILTNGYGFKAGDIVSFISGYYDDTHIAKIFGVYDNQVFVYRERYYCGIDISNVKKLERIS